LAIPVLKLSDGISRMAVPVVSEPVPAVVSILLSVHQLPLRNQPTYRNGDQWPESFRDWEPWKVLDAVQTKTKNSGTFPNRSIDEVEQLCILVNGEEVCCLCGVDHRPAANSQEM
jgi:hypothetical protein